MKRYLYLLAWVEGSDSAGGEATKVNDQKDLYPEYSFNNPHIFAIEIEADSADIAQVYGNARAWHDGYTPFWRR